MTNLNYPLISATYRPHPAKKGFDLVEARSPHRLEPQLAIRNAFASLQITRNLLNLFSDR
jgi:hypothetical protein